MKKLFQRMDQGSREPSSGHTSYIGKVFVVGRYSVTVEDTIAEGGFALVFLVKGSGGVRYALKRLCVNNEHDLQVARNEINILKSLSGERTVVGLLDYQVTAVGGAGVHEVLMLMTYYKRPLLHLLNDRLGVGLTEAEVLKIFCDVCDAVARLHQARPPIIHRDLKVENILCGTDGYVLCDFGSATSTSVCPAARAGGVAAAEEDLARYTTLAYRAPEMVDLYAGHTISTKADIWALGCLLYKLCFFTLPFGESPLAITSGSFTFPTDGPVKYTQSLLALMRYLLTPSPDARPDIFQTAVVAARLAGVSCGVAANINNFVVPSDEQLLSLLLETPSSTPVQQQQQRPGGSSVPPNSRPAHHATHYGEPGGTSVAPRQRPKPQQHLAAAGTVAAGVVPPLPPLQPPPHPTPPPVLAGASSKRQLPLRDDQSQPQQAVDSKQPSPPQQTTLGMQQPSAADQGSPASTSSGFPPAELFGSSFSPAEAGQVSSSSPTEYSPSFQQSGAGLELAPPQESSTTSPHDNEDGFTPPQLQQRLYNEVADAFFPSSGYPDPFTEAPRPPEGGNSNTVGGCGGARCGSSEEILPPHSPLSPTQQQLLQQQQYHLQQLQQQQALVSGLQQMHVTEYSCNSQPLSLASHQLQHSQHGSGDVSPLSPPQLPQHLTTSPPTAVGGELCPPGEDEYGPGCSPVPPERTTSLHRRIASEPAVTHGTSYMTQGGASAQDREAQQQQMLLHQQQMLLLQQQHQLQQRHQHSCTSASHQPQGPSRSEDGSTLSPLGERGTWNPFNDPHPFGQMTEDHIFGAEFDKIRRRLHGHDSFDGGGSNSYRETDGGGIVLHQGLAPDDDPFGAAPFHLNNREGGAAEFSPAGGPVSITAAGGDPELTAAGYYQHYHHQHPDPHQQQHTDLHQQQHTDPNQLQQHHYNHHHMNPHHHQNTEEPHHHNTDPQHHNTDPHHQHHTDPYHQHHYTDPHQQYQQSSDLPEHILLAASPPNSQQQPVQHDLASGPSAVAPAPSDGRGSGCPAAAATAATPSVGDVTPLPLLPVERFHHQDHLVISPPPSFSSDYSSATLVESAILPIIPSILHPRAPPMAAAAATADAGLTTAATAAVVSAPSSARGVSTTLTPTQVGCGLGLEPPVGGWGASSGGGEEDGASPTTVAIKLFTRPPLEDRSKYEKFHNQHDESDEEKDPLREDDLNKFPRSAIKRLKGGKNVKSTTKIGADGKPESVFVCVSDDDSIGSASDLKARINDECEDFGGRSGQGGGAERGGEDISETVSSSVYQAECESVTTHEEDPRVTGTTDPTAASRRGPRPSRASIRARANARLELEKKKAANPDRLLGHEYGEKPLLLDDELDSGEEEEKGRPEDAKTDYKEEPLMIQTDPSDVTDTDALINLQSPPLPLEPTSNDFAPSAPPAGDELVDDDVFALAPFRKPLQKLTIFLSGSASGAGVTTHPHQQQAAKVFPLLSAPSGSVTDPAPITLSGSLSGVVSGPDLMRRPVQTHVIYEESPSEEFPIYENVTLNQNCTIPETEDNNEVYHRTEMIQNPCLLPAAVNNPFTNPFFQGTSPNPLMSDASHPPASLTLEQQRCSSSKDAMSQSVDSLTFSQPVAPLNLSRASSHSSTDLFGSTPFGFVDYGNKSSTTSVTTKNTFCSPLLSNKVEYNTASASQTPQATYKSKPTTTLFSSSSDASTPYHAITSTPRNNSCKANDDSPAPKAYDEEVDDEDLFGSVPFKPILGSGQRSFLGLKSRTLPANMSSTLQSQLNQMGKEETLQTQTEIFKASTKNSKKMTPPSFRKPRLTHQILSSDSESSTDSLGSGSSLTVGAASSSKKSKNRDRSKDRLKYKNIREEFEEENTMVLPMKQFSLSKKEKHSKKHKKQEKAEKLEKKNEKLEKKMEKAEKKTEKAEKKIEKIEKKSEKTDKKYEKPDKKADKSDKKLEKGDKKSEKGEKSKVEKKTERNLSYEAAGISNMSFEDQTLEDARLRKPVSSEEDDEEEDTDLRTTGGNRFGSLKRGINPFAKLSGRI